VESFDRAPSVFSKSGPALSINAKAAWALSLAIHELCTNAVKYGALREDKGSISIDWAIAGTKTGEMFTLRWVERNGPPVKSPGSSGFGSKLINRVLSAELGGRVDVSYRSEGLTCDVNAPAPNVVELG
jgi:two-component sensor histidine kinase